ncbi:TPA: hypothetical protein ACIVVN_000715 [Salmonella enterica subsp. enterica serovar Kottbus]
MWINATLTLPAGGITPMTCSSLAVHPWTPEAGHVTPDGCYLSPVNAITYLAGKLADAPAHSDVMVLMVTHGSHDGFIRALSGLKDVLPLPALTQTLRRAVTQATQPVTRMQIPATPLSGLPAPQPLIVSTLQDAISATVAHLAAGKDSQGSVSDIKAALAGFSQQRRAWQQQINSALSATDHKTASVHAFVRTGDAVAARVDMLKDIPQPGAPLTFAFLMAGDLSTATGWLKEATS